MIVAVIGTLVHAGFHLTLRLSKAGDELTGIDSVEYQPMPRAGVGGPAFTERRSLSRSRQV